MLVFVYQFLYSSKHELSCHVAAVCWCERFSLSCVRFIGFWPSVQDRAMYKWLRNMRHFWTRIRYRGRFCDSVSWPADDLNRWTGRIDSIRLQQSIDVARHWLCHVQCCSGLFHLHVVNSDRYRFLTASQSRMFIACMTHHPRSSRSCQCCNISTLSELACMPELANDM